MNKFSSTILYAIMLFFTVTTVAILVSSWAGFTQLQQKQELKDVRYSSIGAVIDKVSKELGMTAKKGDNYVVHKPHAKHNSKLSKIVTPNKQSTNQQINRQVTAVKSTTSGKTQSRKQITTDSTDAVDDKDDNNKQKGDK